MKRTLTAIATAAAISVVAMQAGAQETSASMQEMKMVEDTVTRFLIELRIPSDKAMDLSLDQARQIIAIADSKEMGDAARVQVLAIVNE